MPDRLDLSIAVDVPFLLGEGGRAFPGGFRWVDIVSGDLWELTSVSGSVRHVLSIDLPLGAAEPLADGSWLASCGDGIATISAHSAVHWLHRPERGRATRMNDAGVDPSGRFLAGSMSTRGEKNQGRLFGLDLDGSLSTLVEGISTPNGPVFSRDGRRMYLADSSAHEIYSYDYDAQSGQASGRSVFARVDEGYPDGMTVDSEDHVWSAIWGGSQVRRYDPAGDLVRIIDIPATQPTTCTFAGPGFEELYITTASTGLEHPVWADGRVIVCRGVGVEGLPAKACTVVVS